MIQINILLFYALFMHCNEVYSTQTLRVETFIWNIFFEK